MDRSSCGRFSCIRFISSRNLVSVRAVVLICWRRLAMKDYSLQIAPELWGKLLIAPGCGLDYIVSPLPRARLNTAGEAASRARAARVLHHGQWSYVTHSG